MNFQVFRVQAEDFFICRLLQRMDMPLSCLQRVFCIFCIGKKIKKAFDKARL